MPQFENKGASLHYETTGAGKPLLLIAGTASDGASWGPLLPLLPGRRLILLDNRASGQTKVAGPITHDEMFDDCAALVDHLGLGKSMWLAIRWGAGSVSDLPRGILARFRDW